MFPTTYHRRTGPGLSLLTAGLLASVWLAGCGDINVAPTETGGTTTANDSGAADTGGTADVPENDAGADIGGADVAECTFGDDAACDDGDPCTVDQCDVAGQCQNTAATDVCAIDGQCYADGAVSSLNACKVCDVGQSKTEWTDVICEPDGNPCTADQCDANEGCNYGPIDGQVCDDGLDCTTDDECLGGQCVATPCECLVDSDCGDKLPLTVCQTASCVNNACEVNPNPDADGLSCDDDDACTIDDACATGECVGTPLDCGLETGACAQSTCTDGACGLIQSDVGAACLAECLMETSCDAGGNCVGAPDPACGCENADECDDGLDCTTDACVEGVCVSTLVDGSCRLFDQCVDAGDSHPYDPCLVCDPIADANAWTAKNCDDSDACTADQCVPDSGECVSSFDEALTCDDGNPCTDDACVADAGCVGTPDDTNPCDDGNPATVDDFCSAGVCTATCGCLEDADCVTNDVCAPAECVDCACNPTAAPIGDPCNDEDSCSSSDVCTGYGECAGTPYACETLSCETATCDGAGGCLIEVIPGTCQIGGQCFQSGAANPENACQFCAPEISQSEWTNGEDGAACDADGDGCTHPDSCVGGVCLSGPPVVCDDEIECTVDQCISQSPTTSTCTAPIAVGTCLVAGSCYTQGQPNPNNGCEMCGVGSNVAWTPMANGTPCDADGTGCTVNDACAVGVCTAGLPASCDDGLVCTQDACITDGATGFDCENTLSADSCLIDGVCYAKDAKNPTNPCEQCAPESATNSWSPVANGTGCNADSSGCTVDDSCQAGLCIAGAAADCDDATPCTIDTCTSTGPESFTCANVQATDTCIIGGQCVPAGAPNPSNPCEICQPTVTESAWTDAPDGFGCDADDSGCTVGDSCQAGTCTAGPAASCDDGLGCTEDSCSSTGVNTFSCANVTVASSCVIGGACVSADSPNPSNPCQACLPGLSQAGWSNRPNGTSCNADSNGCTVDDSCQIGICVAGAAPTCNDSLACTTDSCSSTSATSYECTATVNAGSCLIAGTCYAQGVDRPGNTCQECSAANTTGWSNKSDGTSCNADSDGCTVGDACQAGSCAAGPAPDCGDGKACTIDTCTSTGATTFSCSSAVDASSCLIGGVCYADGQENPNNPCQVCAPSQSTSSWSNKANGTSCNADSNGCTVGDSCQAGSCTAGAAPNCNDNKSCTTDSCQSTGTNSFSCQNTVNSGECLIGGTCYDAGDTNPSNTCQQCSGANQTGWSNKSNGTSCNADSNGCTVGDSCQAGSCTAGAAPNCNDNKSCTTDSCQSTGSSTYSCQNSVNSGNCLIGGTCYSTGTTNPGNTCQQCSSSNQTGWSNKSNGTSCNADSNGCTVGDSCQSGSCTAGAAPNCSDGLSCTSDLCASTGISSYLCSNPVSANSCLILGTCYAQNTTNSKNQCQQCTPSASQSSWSNKSAGSTCDDGLACTDDACNGNGQCLGSVNSESCLIGGKCYAQFDNNPLDECLWCNPNTSNTSWSEFPFCEDCSQGQFCTDDFECGPTGFCAGNQCACQ